MGIHGFAISTNHPFNIYKAGQCVRGKVHFTLDSPQSVRGVFVKFNGIAHVKWTESKTRTVNGKSQTVHVTYHGEHEYFDEKIYFVGEANGESIELQPGDHEHKFAYTLPVGLPSSYEGTYGGIFYKITAGLDKAWAFDEEETVLLKIVSLLDLNFMPNLKAPGHITQTKHLCCLWCRSGPLTIEIDIPKTGYSSGETIHIKADIENLSNSQVTMLELKLKQIILFHSEYPSRHTKSSEKTLCSIQLDDGIPEKSSKTYDENLRIPENAFLNFDTCDLLDVEYELKAKAYIEGCHMNLSGSIPIKMGSIPISFGPSRLESVSILAGLGTPYPHVTEQEHVSQSTSNQLNTNYGWMPWPKPT